MFLANNNLQDAQQNRDDLRIQAKRQANEERRKRYLNAKVRLIGLDTQALDQQVREKQLLKQQHLETLEYERNQQDQIDKLLASITEEEKELKKFQTDQLKLSWQESIKAKKERDLHEKNRVDFDRENCGPASALCFSGEDQGHSNRVHQQREQMRKWIFEQLSEKEQKKLLEREELLNDLEMIRIINELRDNMEQEEKELREFLRKENTEYNRQLGIQQRQRNNDRNYRSDNASHNSLNLFNEDRSAAVDEFGNITRRDMFKGYTEEQRKRFFYENQREIALKKQRELEEKQQEYDWALQQLITLKAMDEVAYQNKQISDEIKEKHIDYLVSQREDERYRKEKENRERFESGISDGFFNGFGQSCR